MITVSLRRQQVLCAVLAASWLLACRAALAAAPEELLQQLNTFPHAQAVALEEEAVIDYEVGLGAMQKRGGAWRFKHSERLSGMLTSYTWQIVDGFTSQEVLDGLVDNVGELEGNELLFECSGRSCGKAVQWANRVFRQRVLYGTEAMQHYRVYALGADTAYRLMLYSAARTADRQYLHAALLRVTP